MSIGSIIDLPVWSGARSWGTWRASAHCRPGSGCVSQSWKIGHTELGTELSMSWVMGMLGSYMTDEDE